MVTLVHLVHRNKLTQQSTASFHLSMNGHIFLLTSTEDIEGDSESESGEDTKSSRKTCKYRLRLSRAFYNFDNFISISIYQHIAPVESTAKCSHLNSHTSGSLPQTQMVELHCPKLCFTVKHDSWSHLLSLRMQQDIQDLMILRW